MTTDCWTELYIAVILVLGGMSVVFSILNLNLHHRPHDITPPELVVRATRLGMTICCMKSCWSRRIAPQGYSMEAGKIIE